MAVGSILGSCSGFECFQLSCVLCGLSCCLGPAGRKSEEFSFLWRRKLLHRLCSGCGQVLRVCAAKAAPRLWFASHFHPILGWMDGWMMTQGEHSGSTPTQRLQEPCWHPRELLGFLRAGCGPGPAAVEPSSTSGVPSAPGLCWSPEPQASLPVHHPGLHWHLQ